MSHLNWNNQQSYIDPRQQQQYFNPRSMAPERRLPNYDINRKRHTDRRSPMIETKFEGRTATQKALQDRRKNASHPYLNSVQGVYGNDNYMIPEQYGPEQGFAPYDREPNRSNGYNGPNGPNGSNGSNGPNGPNRSPGFNEPNNRNKLINNTSFCGSCPVPQNNCQPCQPCQPCKVPQVNCQPCQPCQPCKVPQINCQPCQPCQSCQDCLPNLGFPEQQPFLAPEKRRRKHPHSN